MFGQVVGLQSSQHSDMGLVGLVTWDLLRGTCYVYQSHFLYPAYQLVELISNVALVTPTSLTSNLATC